MKIYIECKGIERIVELIDLKVLDFVKNEEFYFKNKESFLEKYTDLNKEEREVLYKNEDFLKELINFFIINNNIENKYLFEKTISEFSILNNTFLGFFFYNLLKKGYTFDELNKKTNKDLFMLFLLESSIKGLEFDKRDIFETFKKALIENYGEELTNKFLNITRPIVEGNPYTKTEEEIFNDNLNELRSL